MANISPYMLSIVKAELLCYGMRVNGNAQSELKNANPFAFEKTLVHALHLVVEDTIINVCVSEKFCFLSPYELEYSEDFILFKNGKEVCKVDVLKVPDWCNRIVDRYLIGRYIRPHSPNCISCSPILSCGYVSMGKGCKFCSLSQYNTINKTIVPQKTLARMIAYALETNKYELNISAGTLMTKYKSGEYYLSVLRELNNIESEIPIKVSIEMVPPEDEQIIYELTEYGLKSIIFNIEIASPSLRKTICPGKGEISLDHYLLMMNKTVKILGRGNVSSVLLAGIQPADDIIKLGEELITMGVIPTIMPFKPLDDCEMNNYPLTDPEELLHVSLLLGQKMLKEGLTPELQYGCTKCGGC